MNGEIATKTLARLYLSQGNHRKALEIYHEILKREPSNTEIREAIKNLKRKMAQRSQTHAIDSFQDLTRMERIKKLEHWREKIRIIRNQRKNRETN